MNSVPKCTLKYASSSIKCIWVAGYILEGMREPGKSKEVMMWLRFSCNLMSLVEEKPSSSKVPKIYRLCNKQESRENRSAKPGDTIEK
jgi:hypothetical protein